MFLMDTVFQIRVIPSLSLVDAKIWNDLIPCRQTEVGAFNPNPFVTHEFLLALEESGSACAETGWLAQHLLLESEGGEIFGAVPCYLKNHSQGEYVFDYGWADAFMRAGGEYYPKLQCSVPFTPATGPRFLLPDENEAGLIAMSSSLKQLSEKIGASSAHITFLPENTWDLLGKNEYLQRTDQQFHWYNRDYESFEGFLDTLSSRKRKNIRKERQAALQDGAIEIEALTGDQLTESIWDIFFEFYVDTGNRKWGSPYLTREFYSMVGNSMADSIVLFLAKREGHYIAGAINFMGDGCLFGRHWGCIEDHAFLHFELCYYQAIDYAIEKKLERVEAGAQGGHKLARGYEPVTTHSAHWIQHPGLRRAVGDYLESEREHVELENRAMMKHTPFKKTDKG